ncbi:MAG: NAD(P)H-hydrate dehydratase [Spirochaetia bacterium]
MRIVQPQIMAEIDRLAEEEYGIPGLLLMENAGIKAFHQFSVEWELNRPSQRREGRSLVFLAGGGNNGGDALVMARQAFLKATDEVTVVCRDLTKMNEAAAMHYRIVRQLGIPIVFWETDEESSRSTIRSADVLFDGISGTGIRGALHGSAAAMVKAVNEEGTGYVVAIDVPSGVGNDFLEEYPAVKAHLTLTMGLPKVPLYTPAGRPYAGTIRTVKLGFPPQLLQSPPELEGAGRGELLEGLKKPAFRAQDYKNVRGHAAIWAGSVGTSGAAALAAEGAGRAGAGLVSLFTDQEIYPILAGKLSETMVSPYKPMQAADLERRFSALLAGPGWGKDSRSSILQTLLESELPGVIDADGIGVLRELWNDHGSSALQRLTAGHWILTPHPGEFLALVKDSPFEIDKPGLLSNPLSAVVPVARELQVVIVLKSHVVWIVSPDGRFAVVDGMNPAMATGGSGDVLAGIITGILASGLPVFEAACRGASQHQAAGRLAHRTRGWFLAGDLARAVSQVWVDQFPGDKDELTGQW